MGGFPPNVDGASAMAITAKEVMNLRHRTGVGMMECKKAGSRKARWAGSMR